MVVFFLLFIGADFTTTGFGAAFGGALATRLVLTGVVLLGAFVIGSITFFRCSPPVELG